MLEETSTPLNIPVPVPGKGLGRRGVLSQRMFLGLCDDVWRWVVRFEPLLIMRVV